MFFFPRGFIIYRDKEMVSKFMDQETWVIIGMKLIHYL